MSSRCRIALSLLAAASSLAVGSFAVVSGRTLEDEFVVGRSFFLTASALAFVLTLSIFFQPAESNPSKTRIEGLALITCGYIGGTTMILGALQGPAVLAWLGCALIAVGASLIQAPRFTPHLREGS